MLSRYKDRLSLRQRLSRIDPKMANRLLGLDARRLLSEARMFGLDPLVHSTLKDDCLEVEIGENVVRIARHPAGYGGWEVVCSHCNGPCVHRAAALLLVLEHKLVLGLSSEPKKKPLLGTMTDEQVVKMALGERLLRAQNEKMLIVSSDSEKIWTDYRVTSAVSGKSYKVVLRAIDVEGSYCSCPDFRKNTLGICKHIMIVQELIKSTRLKEARENPYIRRGYSVSLRYGLELELQLNAPDSVTFGEREKSIVERLGVPIEDIEALRFAIEELREMGHVVMVYPDAEEYMSRSV